jgi:hypothetical protein
MTASKKKMRFSKEQFEILKRDISIEAIQHKDSGAHTTGYKIGYLIDQINEAFSPTGWGFEVIPFVRDGVESTFLIYDMIDKYGNDKKSIAIQIRLMLYDEDGEVIFSKTSFGGCPFISNNLGDSLKGAQTDALKKAFSYLGLGNEAYKGAINYQVLKYDYKKGKLIEEIKETMEKKYNREFNSSHILGYVVKCTQTAYTKTSLEEVPIKELEEVLETLKYTKKEKKKEVVKDAKKSADGENKSPTTKEKVDKPIHEDDEPPF